MKSSFKRSLALASAHKVWSSLILLAVIGGGYAVYHYTRPAALPQYTLSRARVGNITQTVTGSGQVSAENQIDISSQVSGTVLSINAKVGQSVHTGDLIATIDSSSALTTLQNAQISYAKLTEAPKASDLSSAQNSVAQSYSSAFNTISSTFTDLQTIMPNLNTMLYSQSGFLSNQQTSHLTPTGQTDVFQTSASYDKTVIEYQTVLTEYKSLSRSSAQSTIDQVLADTYSLSKDIASVLQKAQNTITFITTSQPDYLTKDATTATANVASWSNTMNGDVSSLLSSQSSIASSKNSLGTLVDGPDALDLQSGKLSLQQAQKTYQNYFIRAPFDGIIARIPATLYGQASGAIATIISSHKIATLSLNEVDAAKVKAGDHVTITFDAINDLTATGTVSEVDLVGTVSQGVVSYTVKVSIDTDDSRIIPGMSVNTVITTDETDGVLIVPAAAVKTQGGKSYVQTMSPSTAPTSTAQSGMRATTTRAFAASSTRSFSGNVSPTMTLSSAIAPTVKYVTTGASDDANIQITSGLDAGAWVVTKTVAASAATSATAAPSILSGLSGNRATGAATRTGGATFARPAGN